MEEFATKYKLKDIYGAYAAHFSVNGEESDSFSGFDIMFSAGIRIRMQTAMRLRSQTKLDASTLSRWHPIGRAAVIPE